MLIAPKIRALYQLSRLIGDVHVEAMSKYEPIWFNSITEILYLFQITLSRFTYDRLSGCTLVLPTQCDRKWIDEDIVNLSILSINC